MLTFMDYSTIKTDIGRDELPGALEEIRDVQARTRIEDAAARADDGAVIELSPTDYDKLVAGYRDHKRAEVRKEVSV
jgi:hypothetical protein